MRTDSLTLLVCTDSVGKAEGQLYEDEGDGFGYLEGCYRQTAIEAVLQRKQLTVNLRPTSGRLPVVERTLRVAYVSQGRVQYSQWKKGNSITFKIK